jgi:phage-related minor tail protein
MLRGSLNGIELRSLQRSAPLVLEQLAKNMGVARGAIHDLAAEGKITAVDLLKAILESADKIGAEFKKLPRTVDEAFTVLKNGPPVDQQWLLCELERRP